MDINKEIITGLLSRAYKIDDGKIAELLDGENKTAEDVLKSILEIDTQRVEKLKAVGGDKMTFQERYAKTKKEVLESLETQLKDDYKIETDKTGLDLIAEIVNVNLKANGKTGEVNEDDVKKHPTYQTMVRDYKKTLAEKETEFNTKIAEIETNQKKVSTLAAIKDKANNILENLKPIITQNPKVAATIKNTFLNELSGFDYEMQDDGSVIVTKDGKAIDDAHGHAKGFDEIVKSIAENYFDFQGNNGGANAGNENKGGDKGGVAPKFKSQKEVDAYMLDDTIELNDRIKAVDEWNASQNE